MSKLTVEQIEGRTQSVLDGLPDSAKAAKEHIAQIRDMALASVRDAEPEIYLCECAKDDEKFLNHEERALFVWSKDEAKDFQNDGYKITPLYLHPTAQPSADELLREAFVACESHVGRGDDCGRLARLVSHAINATLARSAT